MANKEKKGFWKEFKAFISRGNVLDMAVGIIIGGAFTAIITALVNNILTPLLQWVGVSSDGTGALQLVLRKAVTDADGVVTSPAVIMDFGIVISAIISFLLTAFVLFLIVRFVNRARERSEALKAAREAKEAEGNAEEAPQAEPVPEAAPAPTAEQLLAEIRDLLKAQEKQAAPETESADEAEAQAEPEEDAD